MADETVWNTANFNETLAFIKAYRRQILSVHGELELDNSVGECVLCHIMQEICGNPSAAFALPDINADKPRTVGHFSGALEPEPHHADGLTTKERDKHRLVHMLAPLAIGEMGPISKYTRKRKRFV